MAENNMAGASELIRAHVALTVKDIRSSMFFEKMSGLCIGYFYGFKDGVLKEGSAFSQSIH